MRMQQLKRRAFIVGLTATFSILGACSNQIGKTPNPTNTAAVIDARTARTLEQLYLEKPQARELAQRASGMLVMPLMTEGGLGFGAGYGRGALLINEKTVDYYSATNANFGIQIGVQQYAHVLFFMTDEALAKFRNSQGWAAGGDIEFAFQGEGEGFRASTTTAYAPIIGIIFGAAGFKLGATVEGTKYTRFIP